jgi:hypothetical protein
MFRLEFCDHYSYPPQIKEHLLEILSVIDPSKIRSVLLHGSTASGEIGLKRSDAVPELYSDYDLLYIARGKVDRRYKMKLESHFSAIEKRHGSNLLFRINYSYIDIGTYKTGLNNKSLVTRDDGIVLFGEDLRHLMAELNKKTLDPLLHHENLIWALWKMTAFFPAELLVNKEASSERKAWWIYEVCKETLVIVMWLLPLEDVFIPSYRQRNKYVESHYGELRASTFFGENFVPLIAECYAEKTGRGIIEDPYDLYKRTIECFFAAKKYMLSLKGLEGNEQLSDIRGYFYIDNSLRRLLYDLYLIVCKGDHIVMKRAIQWSLASKYGLMFDILLEMNMALSFELGSQSGDSRRRLAIAYKLFKKLTLNGSFPDCFDSLPFTDAWIALRSVFSEFLSAYIPSLRSFNDRVLGRNNPREH